MILAVTPWEVIGWAIAALVVAIVIAMIVLTFRMMLDP